MKYTHNFDVMEFGKRIRNIRKKSGWTQEQLAEKLMVSVDSISNYENGRTVCMHDHIVHMCELFDVTSDYFFYGVSKTTKYADLDYKILIKIILYDEADKKKIYQVLTVLNDQNNK